MKRRHIEQRLLEALGDSPVVFLNGGRQVGKSTLVQYLVEQKHPATYRTFDDIGVLSSAQSDPAAFLRAINGPLVIDEVQRVPELFLALKAEVDRKRTPGRFLLTGSANVLLLPNLAQLLAGRMEIITLWPFSQGEIEERQETFVDRLFSGDTWPVYKARVGRRDLLNSIARGGFPAVLTRASAERRSGWFGSYITTILQRDVRDLARIEGLSQLPRLLSLIASRAAQLVNVADLSNSLSIPQTTLRRYLALFETTYLIRLLPSWSTNVGKRFIKTPKVFLCDSGLLAYLLGVEAEHMEQQPTVLGAILENFVMMELTKQASWSNSGINLFHFRTVRGHEVDFVLENNRKKIVGIEVKASSRITSEDFRNLAVLKQVAGKRFHKGVVLYGGSEVLPFGSDMFACPVPGLWKV